MPVDRRTTTFYALLFNQSLFIGMLGIDYLFDLRTEYTLGLPVHYALTIVYLLTSGVAPALLAGFYIEHLLDNTERRRRMLIEHTVGLSVFFGGAALLTWYWLTYEILEFFPIAGLVVYLLTSGVLWLAHVLLLARDLLARKGVSP